MHTQIITAQFISVRVKYYTPSIILLGSYWIDDDVSLTLIQWGNIVSI